MVFTGAKLISVGFPGSGVVCGGSGSVQLGCAPSQGLSVSTGMDSCEIMPVKGLTDRQE